MKRTISFMTGKGSVNHNSRKFHAKNTDPERSCLNVEYCNENLKDVYHELFDEALARYNEKQNRNDRRIDHYYEKIRSDKQEKTFHEIILQIGDKDNIDPVGEIIWYQISKEKVNDYSLELTQPRNVEEMEAIVEKICQKYKKLIEDNGLWRLLYDKNIPKHETAAQLLFYGIADAYFSANNIDLSREVHNGHGPVDFKLSIGAVQKILVEIKLKSNPQLMHGLKKQLPLYMAQENTEKAIYLVIDNGHRKRLDSFQDYYNSLKTEDRKKVKYILIDGNIQESASRA